MSDSWDFYFCLVNDNPASIFLDLGIAKDAPIAGYSDMAYIRIYMRAPRDDGLSGQDEFETLKSIENSFESLQPDLSALYVGRNTSDGCRDLYFYARSTEGWEEKVAHVMRAYPEYKYECGIRSDPEWGTYFDFLYPSEEDRERIQNRRTCEALENNGDTLENERPIEYWVYFQNPDALKMFLDDAVKLGYDIKSLIEPDDNESSYGACLSCIGAPSFDNIDELTLPLFRAARDHGGRYDGWETQVVR